MTPDFSVIIPTVGRLELLERCLQSLLKQSLPADRFEVVVVDDGSGLDLSALEVFSVPNFTLVGQARSGPAAARNRGAALARGTHLAFLDDDCIADPHWLSELLRSLKASPESLWAGKVDHPADCNAFVLASHIIISYLEEHGSKPFAPSCNLALSRVLFLELGGFNESYPLAAAEDRDFCDRWVASGKLLERAPARIVHGPNLELDSFLRQHFRYGRGARCYHRASPDGHWQNPLFYMKIPLLGLRAGVGVTGALILSQIAQLAGYLWESGRLLNDSIARSN